MEAALHPMTEERTRQLDDYASQIYAMCMLSLGKTLYYEPLRIQVPTPNGRVLTVVPDFFIPDNPSSFPNPSDAFFREGIFIEATFEHARHFSDHKREQIRRLEASGYAFRVVEHDELTQLQSETLARDPRNFTSRTERNRNGQRQEVVYQVTQREIVPSGGKFPSKGKRRRF